MPMIGVSDVNRQVEPENLRQKVTLNPTVNGS